MSAVCAWIGAAKVTPDAVADMATNGSDILLRWLDLAETFLSAAI